MPTIVQIRFPWGRYHATAWGHHPNEGRLDWPPAPWRLLRALYANWRNRHPELPTETVHGLLQRLAVPPEYRVPDGKVAHTRHYMPDGVFAHKKITEGTDKTLDTFVSFDPATHLYVCWPVELAPSQRDALSQITADLPYLGRAESVCEAHLLDTLPDDTGGTVFTPASDETSSAVLLELLAPTVPLDIAALQQRAGPHPTGARHVSYASGASPKDKRPHQTAPSGRASAPTAIRWTYTSRAQPALTAAVALGHVLRAACQSFYGRITDGAASSVLSGRYPTGPIRRDQHQHAHYLSLSSDGTTIDSLLVWAPGGFTDLDVQALTALRELTGFRHIPDFRPGRLGLTGLGHVEHVAPELAGPTTTWRSLTPFARPRRPERGASTDHDLAAQINRELTSRNHPEITDLQHSPGAWLTYRRHRPDRQTLAQARHATGLTLTFNRPLAGPLSLGALNHFGLGVFVPVPAP